MTATVDVFVSYAHRDAGRVAPLVAELRRAGLQVWFDESKDPREGIADFGPIQRSIDEGLARSTTFLAFYTATYPTRSACQWELTAAWIAASAAGRPEAVMAINGERTSSHIVPIQLADRRHPTLDATAGPDEIKAVASLVAAHVRGLGGATPLGVGLPNQRPPRYGQAALGTDRFVGRLAELWAFHSTLHASTFPMVTGRLGDDVVVVSGIGGSGKTMLAEQYSARFAYAFPGGVFWLHGAADATTSSAGSAVEDPDLADQLLHLTEQRGLDAADRSVPGLRTALAREIAKGDQPCLWVVDDVAAGLSRPDLESWIGPHPLARTIITTRVTDYDEIARPLRLGALTADDGLALLTRNRPPRGKDEAAAAILIVDELDGHSLALDVAGAWLALGVDGYQDYRRRLLSAGSEVLEVAGRPDRVTPTGHSPSITATIAPSLARLGRSAIMLVRFAANLAAGPIPVAMLVEAVRVEGELGDEAAGQQTGLAIAELGRLSLADRSESLLDVHALVRGVASASSDPGELGRLRDTLVAAIAGVRGWSGAGAWYPHARHLTQETRTEGEVKLLGVVASYERDHGLRAAIADYRLQVDAYLSLFGPNDDRAYEAMNRLAWTMREFHELADALTTAEQALAGRRSMFGTASEEVLTSLNTRAVILSALLDDFEEYGFNRFYKPGASGGGPLVGPPVTRAELVNDFEQLVAARTAAYGAKSPDTLAVMANLAGELYDVGRTAEAIELMERVVVLNEEVHGRRDPTTVIAKSNLANLLPPTQARRLRLQLEVVEDQMGELGLGPGPLQALNNMAETLWALGELALARRLWTFVGATAGRAFGDDHPIAEHAIWSLVETDSRSHRWGAWKRRRAKGRDVSGIRASARLIDYLFGGAWADEDPPAPPS